MKSFISKLWAQLRSFILVIALAILVKSLLFDSFRIPSRSMQPTLSVGDFVVVNKFSYGYSRHSLPFSFPNISGRLWFTEPQRGDVAVFRKPKQPEVFYIKRIVGLPGDRVQVRAGVLHINDTAVQREPVDSFVYQTSPAISVQVPQYNETLQENRGASHRIIEVEGDVGYLDDTRVYTVPQGSYFMMGDNRDASQDSRFLGDLGYVPRDYLVGRAELVLFSVDTQAGFGRWFRVGRFLQRIT